MSSKVSIPKAKALQRFTNGINHPELMLWDSWTYRDDGKIHLYTLALNRKAKDGSAITPAQRNDHVFHIRHFESTDHGQEWTDSGSVLSASPDPASYFSRNVWSGSVTKLTDGRTLMGFTGIREVDDEHPFLQSIGLATSGDGSAFTHFASEPLSCPRRDYESIIAAGYYLGPKEDLGSKDGEGEGPILAWRDPYIFIDLNGVIHCFWSAKISPKEGAIAHATLIETQDGFKIKTLHPPITLPDGRTITQAEVPKVCFDDRAGIYYCLVSACDRLYEGQDDCDVTKNIRLYKSKSLRGPWQSYKGDTSVLLNLPDMFGASIIETDFESGELKLIAPITEQAPLEFQLTLAPIQTVKIFEQNRDRQGATSVLHKIA